MHTKRIATAQGKKPKWATTPKPGPHPRNRSIPLIMVIKNIGYADNAREAKKIINSGLVYVDKKPQKESKYGVGLMDVIEIPKTKKYFRVMPGKKGLYLKEINEKESSIKPCKIIGKKIIRGGRTQLNLHDGGNMIVDGKKIKTMDTVVLKLPGRAPSDFIELAKGNTAIIVRGCHSGKVAKINDIIPGAISRRSLTTLGGLQTLTEYLFVVGKESPVISLQPDET